MSIDPLSSVLHNAAIIQSSQGFKQKNKTTENKAIPKKNFFSLLNESNDKVTQKETLGLPAEIAHLPYDDALEILQDTVFLTGDVLKKNQDMESITTYQRAVRNFINFVIKNAYEIKEPMSIKRKNSNTQVKYSTIKIINEKLDSLATGVLYNQQDQLKLLEKIDEIRGLLINLIT
ncbi:MAG: YaaR family protein [Treponemataceae bacterium]